MFHIQNPDKIPTKCLGHETLSFSSHEYCLTCQVFHQFIFCFFLLNCIFFLTYQLNISWLKLFLLNFLPCLFYAVIILITESNPPFLQTLVSSPTILSTLDHNFFYQDLSVFNKQKSKGI